MMENIIKNKEYKCLVDMAMQDGELVHVTDVEKGKKCNCTCIECWGELIARKWEIRVEHFAHANNKNCVWAGESYFHLVAKEILSKNIEITLPVYNITTWYYSEYKRFSYSKLCTEDRIYDEKIGEIRADCSVILNGMKVLIEIVVTHPLEEATLDKIKKFNYSTLIIDLNPLIKRERILTYDQIEEYIINGEENAGKDWAYNKTEKTRKQKHDVYMKEKILKRKQEAERLKEVKKSELEKRIIGRVNYNEIDMNWDPLKFSWRVTLIGEDELIKIEKNSNRKYKNGADFFIEIKHFSQYMFDRKWDAYSKRKYGWILKRIADNSYKGYIEWNWVKRNISFCEEVAGSNSGNYIIKLER